jgi:hypothetical protein
MAARNNNLVALPSLSCALSSLPQATSLDSVSLHPSMYAQHAADSEAKVCPASPSRRLSPPAAQKSLVQDSIDAPQRRAHAPLHALRTYPPPPSRPSSPAPAILRRLLVATDDAQVGTSALSRLGAPLTLRAAKTKIPGLGAAHLAPISPLAGFDYCRPSHRGTPLVAFPFLSPRIPSIASHRHTAYLAIFIPWHLSFLSSLGRPMPSARSTVAAICRRLVLYLAPVVRVSLLVVYYNADIFSSGL